MEPKWSSNELKWSPEFKWRSFLYSILGTMLITFWIPVRSLFELQGAKPLGLKWSPVESSGAQMELKWIPYGTQWCPMEHPGDHFDRLA